MKNKLKNIFKITLLSFPIIYTLCFLGIGLYGSYVHKIEGWEGFFVFIYAHIFGLICETAFFFWIFVLGCFTISHFYQRIYKKSETKKQEKLPYIFELIFIIMMLLHISISLGWIK